LGELEEPDAAEDPEEGKNPQVADEEEEKISSPLSEDGEDEEEITAPHRRVCSRVLPAFLFTPPPVFEGVA
jgi:hypothetical protein